MEMSCKCPFCRNNTRSSGILLVSRAHSRLALVVQVRQQPVLVPVPVRARSEARLRCYPFHSSGGCPGLPCPAMTKGCNGHDPLPGMLTGLDAEAARQVLFPIERGQAQLRLRHLFSRRRIQDETFTACCRSGRFDGPAGSFVILVIRQEGGATQLPDGVARRGPACQPAERWARRGKMPSGDVGELLATDLYGVPQLEPAAIRHPRALDLLMNPPDLRVNGQGCFDDVMRRN